MTIDRATEERLADPLAWEKMRLLMEVRHALILTLEDQHLTQRELARRINRSEGNVSLQLNSQDNMSLGKAAELAFALGKRFKIELVDLDEQGG